jgi:hypothetical protein
VDLAWEHAEVDRVDRSIRAKAHRSTGELKERLRLIHVVII